MEKKWRELELLVKKIEKSLSPKTAIIKSPDYLTDKVTGEKREVDTSIQYNLGSASILIIIECRNRNKPQDVRWIEEIKNKQKDLGASKVIAVSKKGFTKGAIKKAKFYTIELRTFDEINESVIKEWNNSFIVEVVTISYQLTSLKYVFNGQFENVTPFVNLEKDKFKTCIITIDGKDYTLEMFIDPQRIGEYVQSSAGKHRLALSLKLKKQGFINTNYGALPVLEIKVNLIVWKEKSQLNTQNINRYRDIITEKIHEVAYYDQIEISEGNVKIEAYRQHDKESSSSSKIRG